MRRKMVVWLFIIMFVLFGIEKGFATNGVLRDGIGAKSQGLCGAFVAVSDDALGAIYHNPAGIGFEESNIFDIDLSLINPGGNFKNASNDQNMKGSLPVLPDLGFVSKIKDSPFAWGVGLITVAGLADEWRLNDTAGPAAAGSPNYGEAIKNKASMGLMRLAPVLAYQASPELSIGASFGPAYQLFNMEGFFTFQTHPVFSGYTVIADMDMVGWGWGGNLGVLYKVNDKLSLGFSYTTEIQTSLEGDIDLDLSAQVTAAGLGAIVTDPTAHYDLELDCTFPQMVSLGAAYKAFPKLLMVLDLTWIDWSQSFDEFFFRLKNGNNSGVNTLIGSSNINDTMPLKWRDRVTVRLGLEYYLSEKITLRAGYSFGKSPVPDGTLTPLSSAISEHAIALGYGYKQGAWELNIAYQYDLPHRQSVGTSRILGLDYNNSSVEISQHWLGIALTNRF